MELILKKVSIKAIHNRTDKISSLIHQDQVSSFNQLPLEIIELLNTPIDKINLSTRVKNICWNAEINRLSDLANYPRTRFSKLRNAGKKTEDEVELFLKTKGLTWRI